MKERLLRLIWGMPGCESCPVLLTDLVIVTLCIFLGVTYALFDKVAAKKDLTQTLTTKGDPVSVVPESTESATRWQQEGKDNGSQGRESGELHIMPDC